MTEKKYRHEYKYLGEKYRHEYKYLISAGQLEILRSRANAIMQKDVHVQTEGKYAGYYNVRSVYFDDMDRTAYYENENGVDPREKFRIRIYNHSRDRIELQLKKKRSRKCLKEGCLLTRQQCDTLLSGGCLPDDPTYPPVLQKLLFQIKTRRMHPVAIVEYDRIPYVFPMGNVRVGLDMNVRASAQCERFFEEELLLCPVFPTGEHILEIKWDELIPDFIIQSLMTEQLQWSSFSKFYYSCRLLTNYK